MLDTATKLVINPSFVRIFFLEPFISLSDTVVKDLSTEQAYDYRIIQAIKTGVLPISLALLKATLGG